MERRQRQAANGTWERPRHGNNSVRPPPRFSPEEPQYPPSHGAAHPPAFYPDGGAQRTGPWDSRPPYEAGRRGFSSQEESEQRPHRESRVDFTQRGYHEPQQHGAPQGMSQFRPPEGFIHGGTRPGRTQEAASQPSLRPSNMPRADDVYGGNALHSPIIPSDGLAPNIPQHRAPEPAQGVMPYNAPSTQQSLCGRPQQMMPPEDGSNHRREDVAQQHKSNDYIYQSGERHHGGSLQISEERQDPQYRREHPDAYQPDLFHQGGPGGFPGPDPALSQYSGRPPAGFRPDLPHSRSHLQHNIPYQNDGTQPGGFHGGAQTGVQGLNIPPVPDPFMYRAPSPGIQPVPTQNTPQQGHYHLPPVHGNLPNPPYAVYPPAGSVFSGSLEEGNVEIPGFQRHNNHPHHLLDHQPPVIHQDRRQGLDPLIPPRMAGGRNFEYDAPFPQHEVPERHRDLSLLLQHSSPLASQPTPHIEDNFMQTDIEKGSSADKDVFVQWLSSFLSCRRKKPPVKPDAVQMYSIAEARELIYGALRLISQLDSLCQGLESSDKAGEPWTRDYEKAADIRVDLEKRLKELEKPGYIQGVKRKLDRVRKKRLRCQRRRQAEEEEEKAATERSAEKEASIDLWRMQCVQKVEERKRERELKATADRVLGEVRKKQNDAKKMLDVLKALEKLRKLRKEAAGRKGVCPPPSADETFTNHVKRLRTMVHSRSALYDAEEKTLRVILEGEQEEERQREKDKRLKKEKEKTLKKQRELDSILFGDTEPLPSLHPLQPFRQYYLQAEHSVVSLVQIRHEWDQFLVPPDHPDGSNIPRGWVVPTPPSNDIWATALKPSD